MFMQQPTHAHGGLTSTPLCKFTMLNEKTCFRFHSAYNLSYTVLKLFARFYTSPISSESLRVASMGTPPIESYYILWLQSLNVLSNFGGGPKA